MAKLKITNPNKLYFNCDDDFYRFCVVPVIIPREFINKLTGEPAYYMDFDLSYEYKDALAKNKKFVIKDSNSQIFKNKCVSYRTITKPIENLEEYNVWK